MNISLNDDITKQLEERVNASDEFDSVETYVNYVLAEVMKQTGAEQPATNNTKPLTEEEETSVKKRLHDLGYLD